MDNTLLKKIGPQTFAIVWMTKGPLGPECPYYTTFYYLFDGVLRQRKDRSISLIEGVHYGKKLYLLHCPNLEEASSHIKQFHKLIHNLRFDGAEMLFIYEEISQNVKDLISSRLESEYNVTLLAV